MSPEQYECAKPNERVEQNDIITFTSPDGKTIKNDLLVLEIYQDFHCGKKIMLARIYDQSKPEGSRRYSVDLDCCNIQEKWHVM